jgi:hypothetical protein
MKRKRFFIIVILLLGIALFFRWQEIIQSLKPESKEKFVRLIKHFTFSDISALSEWREKILKGKVEYDIEKADDDSYVRAKSLRTASALYHDVKLDTKKHPILSWKWRVDHFPKRNLPETIEGKKEEDFAARVYVMFPAAFFTHSKAIQYIWAETLPKNTMGESGYSKNIKVLVLESGKSDEWVYEKRNIYEDYVKLFGEEPKLDVGAIAFMTDSDSTKSEASAVYDEIEVLYER